MGTVDLASLELLFEIILKQKSQKMCPRALKKIKCCSWGQRHLGTPIFDGFLTFFLDQGPQQTAREGLKWCEAGVHLVSWGADDALGGPPGILGPNLNHSRASLGSQNRISEPNIGLCGHAYDLETFFTYFELAILG